MVLSLLWPGIRQAGRYCRLGECSLNFNCSVRCLLSAKVDNSAPPTRNGFGIFWERKKMYFTFLSYEDTFVSKRVTHRAFLLSRVRSFRPFTSGWRAFAWFLIVSYFDSVSSSSSSLSSSIGEHIFDSEHCDCCPSALCSDCDGRSIETIIFVCLENF